MSEYQVMPELTAEEYAELKADIELRGVMVPIEYDEYGNVLDGYHRLKICSELGIKEYPKVIRAGMTEAEKLTHARKLNMARRQLTQEQRRVLIREQIKATPEKSDRQIAQALGVHHTTVAVQRRDMEESGDVAKLATSRDTLGREQPRTRKLSVRVNDVPAQEASIEAERLTKASNSEHGEKDEIRPCQDHSEPETEQHSINNPEPNPDKSQRKPVTVFNPTWRELTAMRNPGVCQVNCV